MALTNFVERWVDEAAGLTEPRRVVWCDGSKLDRIHGKADARETPIGYVPSRGALELDGSHIAPDRVEAALHVERDEWIESLSDLGEFYRQFGARLPAAISHGLATTARRLTT